MARVTLKQHRFEVAAGTLAALAAAILGASLAVRMSALGPTHDCMDAVLNSGDGSGVSSECLQMARAGSEILGETFLNGEGTISLSVMGVLPFLVGLLGGVPIVSRELEARTAQTAWSLNGSRVRWLGRQIQPIAVVLAAATALAAAAAMPVAGYAVVWGDTQTSMIAHQGLLVLIRTLGVFGLGLAVGAVVGRTLPAFVIAAALSIGLLLGVDLVRVAWTASLEPQVIATYDRATGEYQTIPHSVFTGWGTVNPDGELLTSAEARDIATAAGVPPASEHDSQDTQALDWYENNGYVLLPIGVTDEMALGWAPLDGLIFGFVGVLGLATATGVVQRRRPR